MAEVVQNFPPLPGPMVSLLTGQITEEWRYFLQNLWRRTGSSGGVFDLQPALDALSSTPGALLLRTSLQWDGLSPGVQHQVLRMGALLPAWGFLDGNNFGTVSPARVFAGPAAGAPAVPAFRALAVSDIPALPYAPQNTVGSALTATGANQGTALALANMWNEVTTVGVGTGVRCDNASIGVEIVVFNRGLNALNIYPVVGSQINALGVNNPFSLAINSTASIRPVTGTQLYAN